MRKTLNGGSLCVRLAQIALGRGRLLQVCAGRCWLVAVGRPGRSSGQVCPSGVPCVRVQRMRRATAARTEESLSAWAARPAVLPMLRDCRVLRTRVEAERAVRQSCLAMAPQRSAIPHSGTASSGRLPPSLAINVEERSAASDRSFCHPPTAADVCAAAHPLDSLCGGLGTCDLETCAHISFCIEARPGALRRWDCLSLGRHMRIAPVVLRKWKLEIWKAPQPP